MIGKYDSIFRVSETSLRDNDIPLIGKMPSHECLLEGEKNMSKLIEELTQEQLRSDIPSFRPGDTVRALRLLKELANVSKSSKALLSNVVVLASAKLTQYVKFLTVLVWNVHSHYTLHV